MMVAAKTAPTSGFNIETWCLLITLSTRNFGAPGNTRLHSLPITISRKPSNSLPRRGRTSSFSSGSVLRRWLPAFFFGMLGDKIGPFD